MAYINDEIKHESGLIIQVLQYETFENWNKTAICDLSFEDKKSLTPEQLAILGQWLIDKSKFIKHNFTKHGKLKNNQGKTVDGVFVKN